jgi:hypothetical protein
VTIRDGDCDFDFTPPKEPVRNPGGRPPVKLDEAIAFLEAKLAAGDCKGCELIGEWTAKGEPKTNIFDAKKRMEEEGRLVVDDSRKPQIWHLVKPSTRESDP